VNLGARLPRAKVEPPLFCGKHIWSDMLNMPKCSLYVLEILPHSHYFIFLSQISIFYSDVKTTNTQNMTSTFESPVHQHKHTWIYRTNTDSSSSSSSSGCHVTSDVKDQGPTTCYRSCTACNSSTSDISVDIRLYIYDCTDIFCSMFLSCHSRSDISKRQATRPSLKVSYNAIFMFHTFTTSTTATVCTGKCQRPRTYNVLHLLLTVTVLPVTSLWI